VLFVCLIYNVKPQLQQYFCYLLLEVQRTLWTQKINKMTEQEIIEGNKLIAEFMGETNLTKVKYLGYKIPVGRGKKATVEATKLIPYEKQYNILWDCIMKVIDKIEKLGYDSRIIGNDSDLGFLCDFTDNQNTCIASVYCYQQDGATKLECVFLAVIEFVKWFNTQGVSTK